MSLTGALWLCASGGTAWAQPPVPAGDDAEALSTDRPSFNAPASVVGAGVVQLELGWSTHHERDGGYTSVAPQPQLRLGVSRHVELQVLSDGLEAACVADCAWHGADVAFRSRAVLPWQPLGLALAGTASISVPTGHVADRSRHVEPLAIVHADRGIGEWLEVSYNYLATRTYDDDDAVAAMRHGHGLTLGATANRWTPYVGVARRAMREGGDVPWVAQLGTSYRVARDAQVDVSLDRGLSRVEPQWGILAGLVFRRRPR